MKLKENDLNFLYNNYQYISNEEQKGIILKKAFDEENVEFLNQYINDLPRNMKYEAAIKFKNLRISEEEMREFLKK